jgi:hypothetical protein
MGWGSSKIPPARAALGMGDQTRGPLRLVVIQPCVHGIGVARLQEPGGGHAMGGLAVGDLQEGGASLADIGTRVVVAQPKEFLALLFSQGEGSPDQGWLPCLHVRIVDRDDYDEFTDFDSQKPLGRSRENNSSAGIPYNFSSAQSLSYCC